MSELIFICPKCNIRVYPAEKGVVRIGRELFHENCAKKQAKISLFQRFLGRGSPMVISPRKK